MASGARARRPSIAGKEIAVMRTSRAGPPPPVIK